MHDFEREGPVPAPRPDLQAPSPTTPDGVVGPAFRPVGLDAAAILHLQRTAGNAGVVQLLAAEDEQPSPVHDVVGRGGGQPLDAGTRGSMEQAFGDTFGDVRIHTDGAASRSAESVGANAYTVGSDIVFRSGHGPGSQTFQRDVAHELEHVRQQKSGPVDGSDAPGGIRLSDPSDRFERAASARADDIVAGLTPAAPSAASAGDASVQREVDLAAVAAVQRQLGEEEEEEGGPK